MPVDAITTADVLAILKPIRNVKKDAAPRIKRRIAAVMAWAVAHGHRTDDPVASVDAVLPKQDRTCEHRKALPYGEVPQAITTAWMRPCMAFRSSFRDWAAEAWR